MKKWMAMSLVGVMLIGLMAGCGKKQETGTTTENKQETTTNQNGGPTFKIGGIGPTTGPVAVYGLAVKNAAELAVKEINADGGIAGTQVELNFQDDEHDPEKSINAYNTLKDWGMQVLMGATTSGPTLAVSEKTFEDGMFQLTPSGSAKDCAKHPNVFRVCFSDPDQGAASAKYIGENKLAQKIAIIYDSSDIYSSGIYTKFMEEAKNYDFEVVTQEAFTADNNKDFSTQLQKAKDAGADLLFMPIYFNEAVLILQQAATMEYKPTFYGCDGLDGILSVEKFDTALAEGVMLLTPFAADAQDELTVNFVKNYQEAYGGVPNQFAADAYDAIYAIKAAIEEAGITPDMTYQDTCEKMKEAMLKITVNGLTGEGMTWTEDGEPHKQPKAVVIKNGVYVGM